MIDLLFSGKLENKMETEKIEIEQQTFMDEILEIKNANGINDINIIIQLIKMAIKSQTRNGANQFVANKRGNLNFNGVPINMSISQDAVNYFVDQGFNVAENPNGYTFTW